MTTVSLILFLGRAHEVVAGFVRWHDEGARYYDAAGRERVCPRRFHVFKELGSYRPTGVERIDSDRLENLFHRGRDLMATAPAILGAEFYG